MFDFIPSSIYSAVYYNTMFVVMWCILLHASIYKINERPVIIFSKIFGFFFFVLFLLYIGTRPISRYFEDMTTYAAIFMKMQQNQKIIIQRDQLFNYFMLWSSKVMDVRTFFFIIALIYTIPCYLFSVKYFKSYWFFCFFMLVGSMSFWPYGTNGVRNGMATSLFVLALYFYDRKILMYGFMALAFGFHNSLIIPIAAFFISGIYKSPKVYLYIWFASIILSLIGGRFGEEFFGSLFSSDERATDYLVKKNVVNNIEVTTGFRWDFVLYSASAVFAGWYFIFKKNVSDKFYIHLWGTYVLANAFWIVVIRANFSNRFAYLSWFLMGIIIAYPMLRYKIWDNQYKMMATIIAAYFMFTYSLFIIS